MQDIYCQEIDQILLTMKEIFYRTTLVKNISLKYVFEDKRFYKRVLIFQKNKVHFVDTLSIRTHFWDTAVPFGSENSHKVL